MTIRPSTAKVLSFPDVPFTLSRDVTVVVIYLLLTLILSWPLPANLLTHAVGIDVDEGIFVWNLWWLSHSILDFSLSPFWTDYLFHPVGVSLVFYTLTMFNGLIALPFTLIFGPVFSHNALFIASTVACAYAAYRLVLYLLTKVEPKGFTYFAAFLAGLAFAFSASRWMYASFGSDNLTSTWTLPLFLLCILKISDAARERRFDRTNTILAGVLLAITVYIELTLVFFALFLILPVVLRSLWESLRHLDVRPVAGLVIVGLIGGFAFAPLAWLMAHENDREGQYLAEGWGYADGFSADLLSFVTPTRLHSFLGDSARTWTQSFTDVNIVFLGFGAVMLATVGVIAYWRTVRTWVWMVAAFAVLCLGPLLHINGKAEWLAQGVSFNIPLPYIVLHYIPYLSANRFPNRFSIPMTVALSIVIGFGAVAVLRRVRPFWQKPLVVCGAALLLADSIAVPLPMNDMQAPSAYHLIASEQGNFSIAQIPLGWRNSYGMLGIERTKLQSYQAVHKKYMIGGNISRNPPYKFTYFADLPVFGTIARIEQGEYPDPEVEANDRMVAADLAYLYDLRYLVVHRNYPTGNAEAYALKVLPLDTVSDDGIVALYRVRQSTPPQNFTIGFGSESSRPNRGDGWSGEEVADGRNIRWSLRRDARIFLPRPAENGEIGIALAPYSRPGDLGSVELRLNGRSLGHFPLSTSFQTIRVTPPASAWKTGANALDIVSPVVRPFDVAPFDRTIGSTGVSSDVDIVVQSASEAGGNRASILVDGKDVSRNRRGYNLAAIDQSGKVRSSEAFDTFAEDGASTRMVEWLNGLPNGTIVAAAIRDEGSAKLSESAVAAFRKVGISTDMRGRFRAAHAALGVVGSPPGSALEQSNPQRAEVRIGRIGDTRTLGVAVERITVGH